MAEEISEIIADFRLGEINPRNARRVIQFVDQVQSVCSDWMSNAERLAFLGGLRDSLRQQYWSGPRISVELSKFVPKVQDESPMARWAILSMQESNSSQTQIVNQIESTGIPVFSAVPAGFDGILYIDDATFTGRTLANYLHTIHHQILDLSAVPSKLVIWHICEYSHDAIELLKVNISKLEAIGVEVHFRQVEQFRRQDGLGRAEAALIPRRIHSSSPIVERYLKSSTQLKKIANSAALWRDNDSHLIDDPIFSSAANRDVVEHAFLEVGCWLRAQTPNWNHTMRPYGFVANAAAHSLGFGSMFCTCFNSSNTSPIALWWGDPSAKNSALSRWEPLLPRRPQ